MADIKFISNDIEKVHDFQDASTLWAAKHNQLNLAESTLIQVEKRLNSFRLTVLDNLGLTSRNLTDAEILTVDSSTLKKLSKSDLIRKREHLLHDIAQLKLDISVLNDIRDKFKHDEYIQSQEIQALSNAQQQMEYRNEYHKNPSAFMKKMLMEIPSADAKVALSDKLANELFNNASHIIAASSEFDIEQHPQQVMQAWLLVDRARQEALLRLKNIGIQNEQDPIAAAKAHAKNVMLYNGAQQMFINILNKLPSGMQGLLIIYASRDYEKANNYLRQMLTTASDDNETWENLAKILAQDINYITIKTATNMLTGMANFNKLSPELQHELINQKAYTIRLGYDLSFVTDLENKIQALDDLNIYVAQLDVNIQNAIANNRSLTQYEEDHKAIMQQIDKREKEIRSYYFKKQLTDRPEFSLGVGLGTAWIFGIGVPATAMVIVGVTILKAHMESSPLRLRISDVDESRDLAQMIYPVDYEFLQNVDALWDRGLKTPNDKARTQIKYVADDVIKASVRGAQKAVDAIHDRMLGPILTLYSMQMVAATLFFIAAGMSLPIIWPVFALLGAVVAGSLTYTASKRIVENVNMPDSSLYKMAKAIKNGIDILIIRPVKYIFNAIKNLFLNPSKHAFDIPEQTPDFKLDPKIRAALDTLYPGLANRLEQHFKHRDAALLQRIVHASEINDVNAGIELQRERKQLIIDWHNIIHAVSNKQEFINVSLKFLDRSYTLERREFVIAAVNAKNHKVPVGNIVADTNINSDIPVAREIRNTLLFNKDTDANTLAFENDYVHERQNVQEIYELKQILSRLKSSS